MAALIIVVVLRAQLSRARADEGNAPIPIHPRVVTILQLPDEIVDTWIVHHGEIRIAPIRDKLYVRPRPGTPAGVEASLEVETRTARWTFQLRVVARARDARPDVLVVPVDVRAREESAPEVPAEPAAPLASPAGPAAPLASPAGPVVPPTAATPEAVEPAPTAPSSPASPTPIAGAEPAEQPAGSSAALTPVTLRPRRPEISVHAIGALGFTSLDVAGYDPLVARQFHLGFGARLRVARPGAWWALEANISGERLGGRMSYVENGGELELDVGGSWLRAEVGMRARLHGKVWVSSAYAGLGMQAHLRRAETMNEQPETAETMPRGAVLVLGIGLERRAGEILVGLDFQVREGGPDGYGSMTALWTVGWVLEQGE